MAQAVWRAVCVDSAPPRFVRGPVCGFRVCVFHLWFAMSCMLLLGVPVHCAVAV